MKLAAIVATTAAGWRMSWFSARCRGDLECCAPDRCLPISMMKNPGPCINAAPASCKFRTAAWGQAYLDMPKGDIHGEGCTGSGRGEIILNMPVEFHHSRFTWERANVTVGPFDPYVLRGCYGTSWFMGFVNWPTSMCDSPPAADDELIAVTDHVRLGSQFIFDEPTVELASTSNGAFLTVDLAVALGQVRYNAVRLVAGNADCLLNPVVLEGPSSELGQSMVVKVPGKAFQRRAIYLNLYGWVAGQRGAVEPFTAPATASPTSR